MSKSSKILGEKLTSHFKKQRGSRARVLETGFKPRQLSDYAKGKDLKLAQLDRLADALKQQSWELIKPEDAKLSETPKTPTEEDLLAIIKERDKEIRELRAKLVKQSPADTLVENRPIVIKGGHQDDRRRLVDFAMNADDGVIVRVLKNIHAAGISLGNDKSKRSSSETS